VNAPWILPETAQQTSPDDPRRDIRIGSIVAFLFFVVLLGWAALAPLDAGVHAQGVIAVSGNRQAVQHREGGVTCAPTSAR
jgi:multidrug efflux pump subunit AcrA (membrane-fusion protein)